MFSFFKWSNLEPLSKTEITVELIDCYGNVTIMSTFDYCSKKLVIKSLDKKVMPNYSSEII